MYLKKILIFLFATLLLGTLYADTNKTGEFLGAKDTTMPEWFLSSFLDFSEDIDSLTSQNKRLMLFVQQDSCPYCHAFVTKNLRHTQTKEKLQKHFGVVDINMFGDREILDTDGEETTEKVFAKKHNIQFTPTIIFFDENKKQILRLNGYVDIPQFNLALDYIKDKNETSLSYQEYILKNKKQKSALIREPDLFKDLNNFMRVKDSKKIAIFFESSNCDNCTILHNKLLKDETTRTLLKKIDLVQVDINSQKAIVSPNKMIYNIKDWISILNITHTPTIIFFDEKGKEIIRVEAMFKNFHFQSIVDYVVSDAYKEEVEFQRYLTKRADKIREKGIDINIWD
ncbi:MAG: thioredoxin family protein [Arcobacter sp.]|uniref:thioredoxin family protein n=1 Tax=Arcobacter sp. TaxID=1872629 RepID=UPI003AFF7B4E